MKRAENIDYAVIEDYIMRMKISRNTDNREYVCVYK